MNTKIKTKDGKLIYYEEYDNYETIPEIVGKNKNNIQYLKAITPEDLRPLILNNERNITINSNDIANTQIKVNDNSNDISKKQDKEVWENINLTVSGTKLIPSILFNNFKKLNMSWYNSNGGGHTYNVKIEINNVDTLDLDGTTEFYTFNLSGAYNLQKAVFYNNSIDLFTGSAYEVGKWETSAINDFQLKSCKGVRK